MNTLKAADYTNSKVIVTLVDSVDYMDKDNFSLLMYASVYGCPKVVKELLKKGANIDLQKITRETALMLTSANNNTEIVKLLTDEGAKLDLKTPERITALMVASIKGNTETA
ncbi:MAG: ankyrin repeat domain-containing protein [Bacteroidia bacterium]|nr:ankyrin repeat domain-containing protein [Bacteroidia bacterium]